MKTSIVIVLAVVTSVLLIRSHPVENGSIITVKQDTAGFYPAAVKQVIADKCYGCHSVKGKSQKAKDKLMWDSLPGLPKSKIVGKLENIVDVLDKNDMPPEEFLKKFPDAALLADQKQSLRSWADSKADSLVK